MPIARIMEPGSTVSPPSWSHPIARVMERPRGSACTPRQLLPTLAERIELADRNELPIETTLLGCSSPTKSRDDGARRVLVRADSDGLDPDMVFDRWDKPPR
jgi:hypothetical protein